MSVLADGEGAVVLVVSAVALGWSARTARSRLLADWAGAPARLAEAVLGVTGLVVVTELLGSVGAYRPPWLVATCLAVAAVTWAAARRGRPARRSGRRLRAAPEEGLIERAAAVAVVAVVAAAWVERTAAAMTAGVTDYDSLAARLPLAARLAHSGWITSVAASAAGGHDYRPANAALVHAFGMLALHRDALTPVVNLAWLALGLLAAWCVGRPEGRGHVAVAGAAAALATPLFMAAGPGQAGDDVAALALLLAAVALLRAGRGRVAEIAVAGAAAGLALGTSLEVAGPVLILGAAAAVTAQVARRGRAVGAWVGALAITGGYWYARNMTVIGRLVPSWSAAILGTSPTPGASATHPRAGLLLPAARLAWGPTWLLLAGLAAAGIVFSLGHRRSSVERIAAAAALAGVAVCAAAVASAPASLLVPTSAPVAAALAHLVPSLALALALLAGSSALDEPPVRRVVVLLLGVVTVAGVSTRLRDIPTTGGQTWGVMAGVAVGVAWATWLGRRHLRRLVGGAVPLEASPRWRMAPAAAMLAALGLTWVGADRLTTATTADRYQHGAASPVSALYQWVQGVRGAHIGVVGLHVLYPLAGRDLSNDVRYVGAPLPRGGAASAADLAAFKAQLQGLDLVVVDPNDPGGAQVAAREEAWLAADPSAHLVATFDGVEVWRLDPGPVADTHHLVLPPVPTPPRAAPLAPILPLTHPRVPLVSTTTTRVPASTTTTAPVRPTTTTSAPPTTAPSTTTTTPPPTSTTAPVSTIPTAPTTTAAPTTSTTLPR